MLPPTAEERDREVVAASLQHIMESLGYDVDHIARAIESIEVGSDGVTFDAPDDVHEAIEQALEVSRGLC